MGLIMNASVKEARVRAYGNWFTLKPGEIKMMEERFVDFLTRDDMAIHGLVSLPESCEEVEFRASPEGKALIESSKQAGIANRMRHLKWIITNETTSLQQDIDKNNPGASAAAFAADSTAYIDAAEELLQYRQKADDKNKEREERIKQLQEQLKAIGE